MSTKEANLAELFEKLAAIEHERWAEWQRYVHDLLDRENRLPAGLIAQWERQIAAPYEHLSEREKESDREQVRRYWRLVLEAIA